MNLINDLDTEIAFAVLIEKKHKEKMESKEIFPLIGRLNKALEEVSENDSDHIFPTENINSKIALH